MDIVKRALEIGKELGAEEMEVFYGDTKSRLVIVEKDIVKPMVMDVKGLAFRVAKNKNVSFSYTYDLSEDRIREAIKVAIRSAELKGPDEEYAGFPSYSSVTSEFISNEIREIGLDDLNNIFEKIYYEVRNVKGVIPVGGGVSYIEGYYRVANTNGVDSVLSGNMIMASIYALTREIPPNFVFGMTISRSMNIDTEDVVNTIKSKASRIIGCKEVKYSGKPDIVITPEAFSQLLYVFLRQINASQVKAGMSPYTKDDLGKKIISPNISIIDDPLNDKSQMKTKVDFEGVPTKTKYLVENGVLRVIINDYYHAKALDIEPSANALRYSFWGNQDPVMVEPSISPWYLRFEGKEKKFGDIIGEINDGFLIEDVMGVHQADPVSGRFAVPALAVRIKDGEIKYPIRKVMLSGAIGELLKNVEAISEEREYLGFGEFPFVKTKGITVSSEKSPLKYRLSMKIANILMRIGIIKF